jgi:hypothetical protein
MATRHQGETAKAAAKVDPTVRARGGVPEYPEGTHPPAPVEAQTWGPGRFDYGELEDKLKPDPTSVVSTVESDPIEDANQEALRDSADDKK